MDLHSGWRSMSGKTMLFVGLAAAYYIALNAVLINEIIEQVKIGPQRPVATRVASTVDTADPQDASTSCTQLAKADRDICKVELLVGKASDRFREQAREERRQRRAARDDRRAAPASSPLTGAVHQSAVPVR